MKKQTLLSVLFLLFFFTLGLNKAKAHPGDSCSNPISITPAAIHTTTDYEFRAGDSVMWFSFVVPYSRLTIETNYPVHAADTPRAYIDSLIIYKGNTCGSLSLTTYTVTANGSDSFPSIQLLNFDSGAKYYVKIKRYKPGAKGCNFCTAYFGLTPILLARPIISLPLSCPPCGPNLLCNGNFEDTVVPLGYQNANLGACYQDDSYTYPNIAPPPVGISYCIQSPTIRYGTGCSLAPGGGANFTDIYLITDYVGGSYNNSAKSGSEFMFVDAPSRVCSSCSVEGGPISTPNFTSTAWEENVGVINGATYQFSCWLRDGDVSAYPAATVSININGALPFFSDIIDDTHYNNWANVTYCWSATASSANIQLNGQGDTSQIGYDYEIDSLTYALSSLPTIAYTPSYTICAGSGDTLKSSYNDLNSPYLSYSWSPGAGLNHTNIAEPFASPTVTTTYTCTISTSQGTCTETAVVQVVVNATPTITIASITNIPCNGQSNGSASITASGGSTPYTYLWTPSAQTNANATGLSAGNYTITVTGNNGCTATAGVSITQPTALTATMGNLTNPVCYGGIVTDTVKAHGGTSPYTYSWAPHGGTNAIGTGLTAGSYTVTVTDNHGCTATAGVTITQPTQLVATPTVTGNVSCNGGNNGSASVSASGGTPAYTYLWSSGQTTTNANGLTAGSYTITVTDHNGCTATASVTITQPALLTITANVTAEVSCHGGSNGSASSSATGGTTNYSYTWSTTPPQTNAAATGLTAGSYTVTVRDAHNCSATASVTVTQPAAIVITFNPTNPEICASSGSGGITSDTAHASGGTPAYTYLWSNGQTTSTGTGLHIGAYTIRVTDAHGCTATASITVGTDSVKVSVANNFVCTGTGSLTASGRYGISPYTYSWSPGGQTTAIATGLSAGTYTVTLTDANGCTATASGTLTTDGLSVSISAGSSTPAHPCEGSSISLTANVHPGVGPYTYLWAPGAGTTSSINISVPNRTFTYSVTVTDADGCTASSSITFIPDTLKVTLSGNPIICSTGSSGGGTTVITAHPSGGYSPYTYSWSPSGGTSASATLSAGTYTLTVTDINGCSATASIRLRNDLLNVSITNVHPCAATGTLTAVASGGISPYTYLWAPHGQTTATITGLSIGTYSITVTDSNGCTASASYTINPGLHVTLSGDTVICSATGGGGSTVITATPTGGYSPYAYNWTPSGGTSASATLSSAGTYTVTVTDVYGCTATASIHISAQLFDVSVPPVPVCTPTGRASLTAYPIRGVAPYVYTWSTTPVQTTATATGLSIGSYTVNVSDAGGCTASAVGRVYLDTVKVSIAAVGGANISCGTAPKEYCATASNGISPYVYTWAVSGGTTTSVPPNCIDVVWTNPSADNTLTVTATDSNGCTATSEYVVAGCCGFPDTVYLSLDNFTVTDTSFTSQVGPPSITYSSGEWILDDFKTNASLAINGTLDVATANLQINCSNVLMATGSQIIVESGRTLDIELSHLHSCNEMWLNIDMRPSSTLIINGSLIEDAEQAVYAENGNAPSNISKFTLNGSIFNRDSIDVEVMPFPYTYTGTITKCTFSSDSSLGVPCAGSFPYSINTNYPKAQISPNAPHRGAIGIVVHGVKAFVVGNPSNTGDLNTFIDIDAGIYSDLSSVRVTNCAFTNMTPVTGPISNNPNVHLAGIYSKGGGAAPPYLLYVGGTGTLYPDYPCYFTHCQYGIWARDTINTIIEGNYIEGYPASYLCCPVPNPCYGVYLENNLNTEQHVAYNYTINDCKYGIGAYNNPGSVALFDTNASITTGPWWANAHGVDIYEVSTSPRYSVIGNNMGSVENGVYGANLNNPQIILNNITLNTPTYGVFGIEMDNVNSSFIKRNVINGNSYVGSNGIFINYGSRGGDQIKCNSLNFPDTGLYINGYKAPIIIEQDTFRMPLTCTPYGTGIYLNPISSAFISTNPATSPETNYWNIPTCTRTCPGAPEATYSGITGNGFYTPSTACINDPPVVPQFNYGPFPVIFTYTSNSDNYNCLTSPFYALAPPTSPHDALIVLNDSIAYPIFQQTAKWEARENIYNYMANIDSSLVDSSTVIQRFFDSAKNANLGKIVRIMQLLSDTNGVNPNDLMTATSLNNSITNSDTAESIYKSVYGIMIAMSTSGGEYVPQLGSQLSCLRSIAPLCPAQYGEGVFLARALLSRVDTTTWYDACGRTGGTGEGNHEHRTGRRVSQANDSITNITAKVYPNPANTMLNIEVSLSAGQTVYFEMYNGIGEKIEKMELNNVITSMSINNLPSGMYFYRIVDKSGNTIKADKQMILH